MRNGRRVRAAAALLLTTTTLWLLGTTSASAATSWSRLGPVATPVESVDGVTLAATGLNIMVPVIIGLAALVLGMVLIGWAVLRGGRRPHGHL